MCCIHYLADLPDAPQSPQTSVGIRVLLRDIFTFFKLLWLLLLPPTPPPPTAAPPEMLLLRCFSQRWPLDGLLQLVAFAINSLLCADTTELAKHIHAPLYLFFYIKNYVALCGCPLPPNSRFSLLLMCLMQTALPPISHPPIEGNTNKSQTKNTLYFLRIFNDNGESLAMKNVHS